MLHFYFNKNYSFTEGDILWMLMRHTLICNLYDTKGIKQTQCKQLCKKYDAMRNYYVWIQPTKMIADPLDLHVFFN